MHLSSMILENNWPDNLAVSIGPAFNLILHSYYISYSFRYYKPVLDVRMERVGEWGLVKKISVPAQIFKPFCSYKYFSG